MAAIINLENIQKFMKENNYTEHSLAEAMGISHSYLFRVLRGARQPGRKFIEGLIQAGMSPEEIFLHKALPKGNSIATDTEIQARAAGE